MQTSWTDKSVMTTTNMSAMKKKNIISMALETKPTMLGNKKKSAT